MRKAILLALVIGIAPMASAPVHAQGINCGGSMGEGCWSPQAREQQFNRWGIPRWHGNVRRPRVMLGQPYGGQGYSGMSNQFGGGHQRMKIHVHQSFEEHRRTLTVTGGQQGSSRKDNVPESWEVIR